MIKKNKFGYFCYFYLDVLYTLNGNNILINKKLLKGKIIILHSKYNAF